MDAHNLVAADARLIVNQDNERMVATKHVTEAVTV